MRKAHTVYFVYENRHNGSYTMLEKLALALAYVGRRARNAQEIEILNPDVLPDDVYIHNGVPLITQSHIVVKVLL